MVDNLLFLPFLLVFNYLSQSVNEVSNLYSSYFFLPIKLLFLSSSKICKEYREY